MVEHDIIKGEKMTRREALLFVGVMAGVAAAPFVTTACVNEGREEGLAARKAIGEAGAYRVKKVVGPEELWKETNEQLREGYVTVSVTEGSTHVYTVLFEYDEEQARKVMDGWKN